jgi:hypothetical protein
METSPASAPDGRTRGHALPPSSATMAGVQAAWLAAGEQGDVAAMRELGTRFPAWLDVQRVRGCTAG